MATAAGLLGQADFTGGAGTAVLFTCPDGQKAAVTVTLCNNNETGAVKVRAGWATGNRTAPQASEFVLGGVGGKTLAAGESIQATMLLGPGQKACAGTNGTNVAATCSGLVEALA